MTDPQNDLMAELAYRSNRMARDAEIKRETNGFKIKTDAAPSTFGMKGGMTSDPPVSEAQRKAMYAAREGRSTLGIPKKVGEEFVGKAKDHLGMDPAPTTRAQQKAFCAAASGHSRVGIPQSVGKEHCEAIGGDDYPGAMPYRPVTERDIADKEAMLANAVKDSPDYNRLVDEIEELKLRIRAQGGKVAGDGRWGGRAHKG